MSAEESYRAALRWYPARWRRENGEVLVSTLLDAADADGRTEATAAELHSLRRSGLGAHADALLPRPVRDRVAAMAMGAGLAFALVLLTAQAWAPWDLDSPDGLVWPLLVHPGLLLLAGLAALANWTTASRILLIATLPALAIPLLLTSAPAVLRPTVATLAMLAVLAILAMIGRPSRRWTLVSAGVSLAGLAAWLVFARTFGERYFVRDGLIDLIAGPWPVLLLVAVMLAFVVARQRSSALAVLVFSVPWLVLRTFDALWLSMPAGRTLAPVASVAVLVVVVVLVAVTRRRQEHPSRVR
jgi:hypothetical protein